jgi:hypothetical protein
MENIYTAYTKTVLGRTNYFVKKFLTFPEFNNVPDVLVGYGMHTDYDTACRIAMIHDVNIRLKLLNSMMVTSDKAKVIEMLPSKFESKIIAR